MPAWVKEVRYARNPAFFPFSWQGGVPADLTVQALIGRRLAPFTPAMTRSGGLLTLSLTADQMGQLLTFPGATLLVEIKWAGLVQINLSVQASLDESAGPGRAAIPVTLPPAVTYLVSPDLVTQAAVAAATQAQTSELAAATAATLATAKATQAQQQADRAQVLVDEVLPLVATALPPIKLAVTQPGQTVWNIGGSEVRRVLFMGGLLLTPDVDYIIQLPLLTLLESPGLVPGDSLILT